MPIKTGDGLYGHHDATDETTCLQNAKNRHSRPCDFPATLRLYRRFPKPKATGLLSARGEFQFPIVNRTPKAGHTPFRLPCRSYSWSHECNLVPCRFSLCLTTWCSPFRVIRIGKAGCSPSQCGLSSQDWSLWNSRRRRNLSPFQVECGFCLLQFHKATNGGYRLPLCRFGSWNTPVAVPWSLPGHHLQMGLVSSS